MVSKEIRVNESLNPSGLEMSAFCAAARALGASKKLRPRNFFNGRKRAPIRNDDTPTESCGVSEIPPALTDDIKREHVALCKVATSQP